MSCNATPDWTQWLSSQWGPETDDGFWPLAVIELASNVVCGSNQPYFIQDFFAVYPMFGGAPVSIAGVNIQAGITGVSSTAGFAGVSVGNPVAGPGIPDGTFVQSITDANDIVLSNAATADGSISLTVWNASTLPTTAATTIPTAVVSLYIALATASLVQARWQEQWPVAMSLFVAHYLTLYARAAGNPTSTIGQIAAGGLAFGIQVSKAVGDVSVSYQPIIGWLEQFGAWNLTLYGQLLATMALTVGGGPMLLY